MRIETKNYIYTIGWSWIGFFVGILLVLFTLYCARDTHNYWMKDGYKAGYADGYQSRINEERTW